MNLVDIYFEMKKDVEYIENQLELSIDTGVRELYQSSTHLLKAGGKRIRPVFVLLGGKWGSYDVTRLKYVAVPLELIHMATLVHDDVVDNADKRRGRDTVKTKWDNKVAMYLRRLHSCPGAVDCDGAEDSSAPPDFGQRDRRNGQGRDRAGAGSAQLGSKFPYVPAQNQAQDRSLDRDQLPDGGDCERSDRGSRPQDVLVRLQCRDGFSNHG